MADLLSPKQQRVFQGRQGSRNSLGEAMKSPTTFDQNQRRFSRAGSGEGNDHQPIVRRRMSRSINPEEMKSSLIPDNYKLEEKKEPLLEHGKHKSWMQPTFSSSAKKVGRAHHFRKRQKASLSQNIRADMFEEARDKMMPEFTKQKIARDKKSSELTISNAGASKTFICDSQFRLLNPLTYSMSGGKYVIKTAAKIVWNSQQVFTEASKAKLAKAVADSSKGLIKADQVQVTSVVGEGEEILVYFEITSTAEVADKMERSLIDDKTVYETQIAEELGHTPSNPVRVNITAPEVVVEVPGVAVPPEDARNLLEDVSKTPDVFNNLDESKICISTHDIKGKQYVVVKSGAKINSLRQLDFATVAAGGIKAGSTALIHAGFYAEASRIFPKLFKLYSGTIVECFVGHGFGGAVATILAWMWPQPTHLITFGCPMVGDRQFVEEAIKQVKSITRYRFKSDPVPFLPQKPEPPGFPYNMMCCGSRGPRYVFEHVGPSVHLTHGEAGEIQREIIDEEYRDLTEAEFAESLKDHAPEGYVTAVGTEMVKDITTDGDSEPESPAEN